MNNRLVIIGAGGHGKVVADNALKNGYTNIGFLDDQLTGFCMGFPILGETAEIQKFDDGSTDFVIGIGNNAVRKMFAERYDVNWIPLIHPSAQIGACVTIGKGSVVMAGAIVNACATVGEHCIINTGSIVEHDNIIANFVDISPGVKLGGTVRIGEQVYLGIGSVVSNNVDVCDHCVIGAGAVVVKNLCETGTYVGVPVKMKK